MIFHALEASPYLLIGAVQELYKESNVLAFTSLQTKQRLANISFFLKIATKYFNMFFFKD